MNSHSKLYGISEFVLFITSYIPLFILIISKQISVNFKYLNWGGLRKEYIYIFITKFGFSSFLITISVFGTVGCFLLFSNFNKNINNGENVTLIDVKNKNNESIGYIATYIMPFIFQSFSEISEIFSFLFLMLVIYRIYINSNLLLINPILSFIYSIYEVEYEEQNGKKRNGLIIIKDKLIEEETIITIYSIGHKLFFAKNR